MLLASFAGTVAYVVANRAVDVVLGPGQAGNTSIFAAIVIGLFAGTVAAGLTLKARTVQRWIGAFLLMLVSVAALGLIVISPYVFWRGI